MLQDTLAQPVKFLLVGVINTIVGYGVMFGAYNLLPKVNDSAVISPAVSVI